MHVCAYVATEALWANCADRRVYVVIVLLTLYYMQCVISHYIGPTCNPRERDPSSVDT